LAIYELAYNLRIDINSAYNMDYEEFLGWQNYFERRPLGWREDDRTYKLLSAQGVKAKAPTIFPSLDPIYNPPKKEENTFDPKAFKRSFMYQKILTAKGGDTIL
jgi:hypothetical protein